MRHKNAKKITAVKNNQESKYKKVNKNLCFERFKLKTTKLTQKT